MKKIIHLLSILFALVIINSCKKNNDSEEVSTPIVSSDNVKITIAGMVLSANYDPLQGVTVTAQGQSTTTDINGIFTFKNIDVNKQRCSIKASLANHFTITRAFIPVAGTVNYTKIVLHQQSVFTFNSTAGTTYILPDNSVIHFTPNSFVNSSGAPFTGDVTIKTVHLSPDDINFGYSIPGGDLNAKDSSGKNVVLNSYGMMGVELVDAATNQQLQIAPGNTAGITFAIAPSQLSTAPASIPLWYFDATTSLWVEQGAAIKVGNYYEAVVTHFSWWNCDVPFGRAFINGRVVDCNGNPVANATVTINGLYTLITSQNGTFSSWVPANLALTAQVISTNNFGLLNSLLENIPPLAPGQVFAIPDLMVPCPAMVTGTLVGCTGASISGIVYLTNGNTAGNFLSVSNGSFSLFAPANAQVTLYAYTANTSSSTSITTPAAGGVYNVGNLILCSTTTGTTNNNSFMLNGGGFTNQKFVIDTTLTTGYYDPTILTGGTAISVFGHDSATNAVVNLVTFFPDSAVGIYANDCYINLSINGVMFLGYNSATAPVIFDVNQYDAIGGRIKAEFSAVMEDSIGVVVNLTQGRLNVARN